MIKTGKKFAVGALFKGLPAQDRKSKLVANFAEGRVQVFASLIEKSSLRDSRNPTTPDLNVRRSSSGRPPPFQGNPPCSQAPRASREHRPGPRALRPEGARYRPRPRPEEPTPAAVGERPSSRKHARSRPTHRALPACPGDSRRRPTPAHSGSPPPSARSGHTLAPALCVFRDCSSHAEPVPRGELGGGTGVDRRRAGGQRQRGLGSRDTGLGTRSPRNPVHNARGRSETSPSWPWGVGWRADT